jgi:death on curing protein
MMLAQHGGLAGVRDFGLLESALNRPRHLLSYGRPTIQKLAAAYAFGIVRNHPFNDGNKRTGFMVAATFLEVNGQRLIAAEHDVVTQTVALATRKSSEAKYAAWLTENTERDR